MLTRPACLLVYWISWRHFCSLCRYGRLHRNVPILAACLIWWLGAVCYGLWLWRRYQKGACPRVFCRVLPREQGLGLAAGEETDEEDTQAQEIIAVDSVKWYTKKQKYCQLFLKDKRVLLLDMGELSGEDRDFLDLKLSAVRVLGKKAWRATAGIFLAAVTLRGAYVVAESALPYQGKLAWYLEELEDKRTCALKHDNVYEWGIEGILEDVREKVDLPETLSLVTSFNLHFAPDGEILSFDTMLCGFDREGDFVDSYLISYNRKRSQKITIYLHGACSTIYDASKDLEPLVEAVSLMPLGETVAQWEGEECFGILYYGARMWNDSEGIRFLDRDGTWRQPFQGLRSYYGYSISVFCPENEEAEPVRYFYPGQKWQ